MGLVETVLEGVEWAEEEGNSDFLLLHILLFVDGENLQSPEQTLSFLKK